MSGRLNSKNGKQTYSAMAASSAMNSRFSQLKNKLNSIIDNLNGRCPLTCPTGCISQPHLCSCICQHT